MDAPASSRSSDTASWSSSTAWPRTASTAGSTSVPRRSWAARSSSASATSRCCAPSWMSRSIRRRSSSPAATIRRRDSCTRPSCARSSAARRAFSSARRAAMPAASSSRGSSSRLGSWTSAAIGSPSWSSRVTARWDRPPGGRPGCRRRRRRPPARAARRRSPARGRRPRGRGPSQLARWDVVEIADQVGDVRGCEPGAEQAPEERERQGDHADDLPPVDPVRDRRDGADEHREELVERSQRDDGHRQQQWRHESGETRRRADEPPDQERRPARW